MKSTIITLTYDEFAAMLKEVKQAAIDNGSMTEPEGYSELDGKAVAVADDCLLKGMSDMETAALNWAFDYLNGEQKIVPPVDAPVPYPDSPEAHEDAMIADEAEDAMRNLPLVGRDNIPTTHPRRIAQLSLLSDRDLQHEPEEVRRLVGYHRDNQLFPTCEAVGHCPKPTAEAAPFHHFYWDGERDTERMEKIHNGGRGHDDPLSNYGAVECKTCGRKALVLSDADDFPQI